MEVDNPTKQDIVDFLLNRVNGKASSMSYATECDVYGDEELWRKQFQENPAGECVYFFTKLEKATHKNPWCNTSTGRRNSWEAQREKKIFMGELHSGSMISFRLAEEDRCTWLMHEYRLDGVYDFLNQGKEYVICRIKRVAEGDDDQDSDAEDGRDCIESLAKEMLRKANISQEPATEEEEEEEEAALMETEGGYDWIGSLAKEMQLANVSQGPVEEEEIVMIPNLFFQDRWVRGWEILPTGWSNKLF